MRRATVVLLLTIPVAALLLDRTGLFSPFRSTALTVTTPLTGALVRFGVSIRETVSIARDLPALVRENAALTVENRQLVAELALQADVAHENDLLRTELSLPAATHEKRAVAAFIVGRSRTGPFGTYLLNRGTQDGIASGQAVLSQETLVGRITEVYEMTSVLTPITNVNSSIPVVFVESRGIGILRGGVRGLAVEEVSRDVQVLPGEAVVTSELGSITPAGILVGTVEAVSGNPADVFQAVTIRSNVPFNWLELVMVREP